MNRFELLSSQVVVMDGKRSMVRETPDLIATYLRMNTITSQMLIFSDNGNAFSTSNDLTVALQSPARAATYPSCVHQFLSPNDSNHHGRAKAQWRAKNLKKKWDSVDPVTSDLYLLRCLTYDDPEAIAGDFQRNFFLGKPLPRQATCCSLIDQKARLKKVKLDYFAICRGEYKKFQENNHESDEP